MGDRLCADHRASDQIVSTDVRSPAYWDARVDTYEKDFYGASALRVRALEEVASHVRPVSGQHLLDIGTGSGRALQAVGAGSASQRGWVAIGLDLSLRMLRSARAALRDVNLIQGSAWTLPFADRSFDWVISSMCFHHVPPKERLFLIDEIRRVLRATGQLIFADEMIMTTTSGADGSDEDILRLMLKDYYPHLSLDEGRRRFQHVQEWPISGLDWDSLLTSFGFTVSVTRISDMAGVVVAHFHSQAAEQFV